MKQLDTIYVTLPSLSPTNSNFIVNIFQKVFSSSYGPELHRLQQKYYLSLGVKVLSMDGIRQSFLEFVTKNTLFLNKYVSQILRNLLDKNFDQEEVRRLSPPMRLLFTHAVLDTPLDPSPETTQHLLTLIQRNIRNKTLFEDLVLVLRKHLKTANGAPNADIVRKLFLSESLFWKLVRLYKKDQINLSKILKYLLLICRHFDFLGEITVPPPVVRSILNSREINKFNDVYMLLLSYILKNNLYATFQTDIERFFLATKSGLDSLLFFAKQVSLDDHLRPVYYALKVLRNCSSFVKAIPSLASLDTEDFAVRYVLQLMDENSRLEVVPINNLYNHFRKRESVQANFKTALYESKIVHLVFAILQSNPSLFSLLLSDFFVVNKLISFAYLAVSGRHSTDFIPMAGQLLVRGLEETQKDVFKDTYYDLYLLLNYEFRFTDTTLTQATKDHILDKKKSILPAVKRIVDELRRKGARFDSMGYNSVIRGLLRLHFILDHFGSDLFLETFHDILTALDALLEHSYKEVHALTNLEKLIVNLYVQIHTHTLIASAHSARVFLWLFNTHVEFKVSSLVDKYIYMGLFNNYLRQPKDERLLWMDPQSGHLHRELRPQADAPVKLVTDSLIFDSSKVAEAMDHLRFATLAFENEVILVKFLLQLSKLNQQKFFEVPIRDVILTDKSEVVFQALPLFTQMDENNLILLKLRIKMVILLAKRKPQRVLQWNQSFF